MHFVGYPIGASSKKASPITIFYNTALSFREPDGLSPRSLRFGVTDGEESPGFIGQDAG